MSWLTFNWQKKLPKKEWCRQTKRLAGGCHMHTCVSLTSLQKAFFAAVNATVKWSSGLKERVFKGVIFNVIVMYYGYFFHCVNYKPCCQVDNSGVYGVTLNCFLQAAIMLKFTVPRGALSLYTFHIWHVLCRGLTVMAKLLCCLTVFSDYRVKNAAMMNPCTHIFMHRTQKGWGCSYCREIVVNGPPPSTAVLPTNPKQQTPQCVHYDIMCIALIAKYGIKCNCPGVSQGEYCTIHSFDP